MLFIIFSRFGTEVGLYVKTGQPATCLAKVNIFSIENSGLNGIQTHIRLQSCTPPKGKFNYIVSHFRSLQEQVNYQIYLIFEIVKRN